MFTDWTQTDPQYFYLRGALFGFVLTSWAFMVFMAFRAKAEGRQE